MWLFEFATTILCQVFKLITHIFDIRIILGYVIVSPILQIHIFESRYICAVLRNIITVINSHTICTQLHFILSYRTNDNEHQFNHQN